MSRKKDSCGGYQKLVQESINRRIKHGREKEVLNSTESTSLCATETCKFFQRKVVVSSALLIVLPQSYIMT